MKRIGLFGGTFNPIHNGHIRLADAALKKLELDRIYFIPTRIPPHKRIEGNVKPMDRVKMVRLAVKGRSKYKLSLYEINRRAKSYSFSTLGYFNSICKNNTLIYFIMGSDNLISIRSWKKINKALKMAKFVAFSRPGYRVDMKTKHIDIMRFKALNVSSEEIRRRVRKGAPIKGLVPEPVRKYIIKKRLYQAY